MSAVKLEALKLSNNPHLSWNGELWGQRGDWIITRSAYGTPVCHHTRKLSYKMTHSNIGIFNTKQWYNVFIDFDAEGNFEMLYVNIATPAILQGSVLTWKDLYLDIIRKPGKAAELVDQDELDEAIAKGDIRQDLAAKSQQVAGELMKLVDNGDFPFLVYPLGKTSNLLENYI